MNTTEHDPECKVVALDDAGEEECTCGAYDEAILTADVPKGWMAGAEAVEGLKRLVPASYAQALAWHLLGGE